MSARRLAMIACVLGAASSSSLAIAQPAIDPDPAPPPTVDPPPPTTIDTPPPTTPPKPTPTAHNSGKGRPDKYKQAAREAFEAAMAADAAGNLKEAVVQYRRAQAIAPHPFTTYNLADVLRRQKLLTEAIREYEAYLQAAPEAADRGAVEAMIDQLHHTPALVTIDSREPRGRVFVDGKLVGDAPIRVEMFEGHHQIDVITPITYGHEICSVSPGQARNCTVSEKPRVDGNVVLSGPDWLGGRNWQVESVGGATVNKVRFEMHGRFVAPPGNYPLYLLDKSQQCQPAWTVVQAPTAASADDVLFIYADVPPEEPHTGGPPPCRTVKLGWLPVKFKAD